MPRLETTDYIMDCIAVACVAIVISPTVAGMLARGTVAAMLYWSGLIDIETFHVITDWTAF